MGTITENVWPFTNPGDIQKSVVAGTVVASTTAMPAPAAYITTVSGTVAIATIALPYPGFTGCIKYIPTGAFTGVTSGVSDGTNQAIGLAFSTTVGKVLELCYDGAKWWPGNVT